MHITLNKEEPIFLCTWDGDQIIELHTEQSLKAKYGDTNLYDRNTKWEFSDYEDGEEVFWEMCFEDLVYHYAEIIPDDDVLECQFTVCRNENMTIQRIV